MYSIKDVAARAGVSVGTVSNVINKKGNVSIEKVEKVNVVIQELNFKPSRFARGLKLKKTHTIALLIPKISTPFYAQIIEGVEAAARDFGYDLILYRTQHNPDLEQEYMALIDKSGKVDGVLMTSLILEEKTLKIVRERQHPVVFIETMAQQKDVCCVAIDNKAAMRKSVEYMVSLGHKKIAFINGNRNILPAQQRWDGFKEVLEKHEIPLDEKLCYHGEFDMETGMKGIKTILGHDTPTAVICAADTIAQGVYNTLQMLGYSIPKDISVMGFDDVILAASLLPGLTTIKQPIFDLGYQGAKKLIKTIESGQKQDNTILDTELVIRDSVRKILG